MPKFRPRHWSRGSPRPPSSNGRAPGTPWGFPFGVVSGFHRTRVFEAMGIGSAAPGDDRWSRQSTDISRSKQSTDRSRSTLSMDIWYHDLDTLSIYLICVCCYEMLGYPHIIHVSLGKHMWVITGSPVIIRQLMSPRFLPCVTGGEEQTRAVGCLSRRWALPEPGRGWWTHRFDRFSRESRESCRYDIGRVGLAR